MFVGYVSPPKGWTFRYGKGTATPADTPAAKGWNQRLRRLLGQQAHIYP